MGQEKDTISLSWSIQDVQENTLNERDISDDQARAILQLVNKNHDANVGVNWEVLDVWADYYFDEIEK